MHHTVRQAAIGVGILISSKSVSAQSKTGSSTSSAVVGIDRLVLDEQPKSNVTLCYSGSSKSSTIATTTDTLSIAPQAGATDVQVDFSVASIQPNTAGKPMVLFLAYSTTKETTPQIASKNTSYPFLLGGGLQILAAYNLQPMTVQAQGTTTIGSALSEPSAKLTFTVKLDLNQVNTLIASSANRLYFQAGLMTQEGLSAGDFSTLILSEVDTIEFNTSCTGTSTAQSTSSGKTMSSGSTCVVSSSGSKTSGSTTSSSTKSATTTRDGSKSGSTDTSTSTSKSGSTSASSCSATTTSGGTTSGSKTQ